MVFVLFLPIGADLRRNGRNLVRCERTLRPDDVDWAVLRTIADRRQHGHQPQQPGLCRRLPLTIAAFILAFLLSCRRSRMILLLFPRFIPDARWVFAEPVSAGSALLFGRRSGVAAFNFQKRALSVFARMHQRQIRRQT